MNRHVLKCCKCPTISEDIQIDPRAWNGWQYSPEQVCPDCIDREIARKATHQLIEQESHSHGKVIRTLNLVAINQGRSQ